MEQNVYIRRDIFALLEILNIYIAMDIFHAPRNLSFWCGEEGVAWRAR